VCRYAIHKLQITNLNMSDEDAQTHVLFYDNFIPIHLVDMCYGWDKIFEQLKQWKMMTQVKAEITELLHHAIVHDLIEVIHDYAYESFRVIILTS
jgi:hypothetical protein